MRTFKLAWFLHPVPAREPPVHQSLHSCNSALLRPHACSGNRPVIRSCAVMYMYQRASAASCTTPRHAPGPGQGVYMIVVVLNNRRLSDLYRLIDPSEPSQTARPLPRGHYSASTSAPETSANSRAPQI